jgi:succinyl-CoA synthetase beta subunit
MGFHDECQAQAADIIKRLYDLFIKNDGSLLEINPMAEDADGNGIN